ncbi:MAG: hypothetical protein R3242_08500 [Akkermansiaceae bacterium]|nr:hypothetical protein [Akkermansiaceae bacterium]
MSKQSPDTMRVFDPFLFLIGHRGAIERIAATPWALLVGAVFVVSAGIARNYDHLVLTQEPEWIAGPFIASIATTLFIYFWVWTGLRLRKTKGERNFLTFLTLVWMTAPCAWIYGIPVESYTDIVTATRWNIGFLAIVSLWRVVLMVRAICVLSEAPVARVSLLVLTPAAFEMMIGAWNKGLSIVGIMGGVRLSPEDELLLKATNITATLSFWTFVFGVALLFCSRGRAERALSRPVARFPITALIAAAISTTLWAMAVIPHHRQLSNRHHLRQLFRQDAYEEAVAFASSKQRGDFPAIHYLVPEPDMYRRHYPIEHLEFITEETPYWLREEWIRNAFEFYKDPHNFDSLVRYTYENLERKPDGFEPIPEILFRELRQYADKLEAKESLSEDEEWWLDYYRDGMSVPREVSPPQR